MSLMFVGPHGISDNYGWFHVYSFTMFLGIAMSIIVSWYKMQKNKVPTDGLSLSVIFIIPAALFGASYIGKNDPLNPIPFFSKFEFWKPGLSIHGGVLFGVLAGIVFFAIISRKTKISMWTYGDCIIPNILLGQVIGRWGNFFNHELLGDIVGYSSTYGDASHISALSWLPAFIRDNCFKLVGGSPEIDSATGMYVFRAPIFLYESLANLSWWIILTFLIPKSFKWFSKKPWKQESARFKLLTIKDMDSKGWVVKNQIVLSFKNHSLKQKYWNQAFYDQKVTSFELKNLQKQYHSDQKENAIKAYFKRSSTLYHLNNPNGYFIMRSGVQMWLYFFGWNLIRFCLELQRSDPADLFLINNRPLDYAVLISIFVIGLILAILSQFIFARFFRKQGWVYEKEY